MKNTIATLIAFPAFASLCLADEILIGNGFEPVINSDRVTDVSNTDKRLQLLWVSDPGNEHHEHVRRGVSHDLGSSWGTPVDFFYANSSFIDGTATCNVGSTAAIKPMYFGWFVDVGMGIPRGTNFRRSLSGDSVDNEAIVQSGGTDRPWLTCNTSSLYCVYNGGTDGFLHVKKAAIPSGNNAIAWPDSFILEGAPSPNTLFNGHFPIVTTIDFLGTERVFVMARQTKEGAVFSNQQNSIKLFQSTDGGATFSSSVLTSLQGVDGWIPMRDQRMVPYSIACDPVASTSRIYAFYARNETSPFVNGGGKRNVLYSMASYDGGSSWNGERLVYTISASEIPSAGFAQVPSPTELGPGFYRIGRVWSCVAPNGNVYVVWMDNRYGAFSTTQDYWHVFYSRSTDMGQTWSAPVRVSAPTKTGTDITLNASIGGFGQPLNNHAWEPPGDFLSCDADNGRLYVAWPDSRAAQSTGKNEDTRIYVNVIPQS